MPLLEQLDAFEQFGHAFAAGGTLAARFVDEELQEVLHHVEHVALRTEDDDRAAGGNVLEGQAAVELGGGNALAGGPADLHRLGPLALHLLQQLGDGDAQGKLVDAGQLAVAGDAEQLVARRFVGAVALEPLGAAGEDADDPGEGLDVVDDRGPAEVAGVDGEGGAVAGLAAMALQRLDHGGLFAADVGPRAHVNVDVEIEALAAGDVLAQQVLLAAARQHGLQVRRGGRCIPSGDR